MVFGFSNALGWRLSMLSAGMFCLLTGIAYYAFTQDAPDGNFKDLRAAGKMPEKKKTSGAFIGACKDLLKHARGVHVALPFYIIDAGQVTVHLVVQRSVIADPDRQDRFCGPRGRRRGRVHSSGRALRWGWR